MYFNFQNHIAWFPPHTVPECRLPGTFGRMIEDFQCGGLPYATPAAVVLAFASLLAQGQADICWPRNYKPAPVGMNLLLLAPSGSGKSLVFDARVAPVNRALDEWRRRNPCVKTPPVFFLEDATREAVVESLLEWNCAALFTDEGGLFKRFGQAAPTMAKLLDGAELHHARVSTGRVTLRDQRLCILATEQPGIDGFAAQLASGANAGVGLINRFLFAKVEGAAAPGALFRARLSRSLVEEYEKRVEAHVARTLATVQAGGGSRRALRLTLQAEDLLIAADADCRAQFLNGVPGQERIHSYVVRHAERSLRLARALHVFEHGPEDDVEVGTLEAAEVFARWSLRQWVAHASIPAKVTQAELDAEVLDMALCHLIRGRQGCASGSRICGQRHKTGD